MLFYFNDNYPSSKIQFHIITTSAINDDEILRLFNAFSNPNSTSSSN
jgi:hypothetical protein